MPNSRPPKLDAYQNSQLAANYDLRWASRRGRRRDQRKAKMVQLALQSLPIPSASTTPTLLDIPFGTGRLQPLWQQHSWCCIGADLSLAMLQVAQDKHPQSTLCVADLAQLPFANQSFDYATCIRLFHLVREPSLRMQFLRELRRVCRHGAVVNYQHAHTFRIWGQQLRHRLGHRPLPPANPSYRQIRQELAGSGWRIASWIPARKIPWMSDKLVLALVPADSPTG